MRFFAFLFICTTIVLTACSDLPPTGLPEEGDGGPAAFAILDGSTADSESSVARQNTFFLPPLVDDPVANGDATGEFDPTHQPIFRILEIADEGAMCGIDTGSGFEHRSVAVFTMDDGPGEETVRVVPDDEHYIANWHTDREEFGVDPNCIYQIQVLTAGLIAATADVQVASNGRELQNVNSGENVALKDGRTLVMKVRIQEFCAPGEVCSAGFIDPTEGGTVSVIDPVTGNLAAELDCGAGCADEPFVLSLTLLPDDENPSPDLEGQFPYFVSAEAIPTVTFTEDPGAVFTVCQTVAFQEERTISDASLRLFRVDDGVTEIRDDPSFASQCAAPGQITLAPVSDATRVANAPSRLMARALDGLVGLFAPEPLGAAMFLHGGLNTTLRNETFSDWGATDVAQIEATVLVDGAGEEGVTVDVAAPNPDFDATAASGQDGTVTFGDLPIFEGDPLVDEPEPAYTVSVDEATLPAGVTCTTSSEDVFLDAPGETESVTFACTGLGSIAGIVQDGSQQPLPGANVLLGGTNRGAITDENGQFILTDVPVGTYTLQTSILGFTCPEQEVTVAEGGVQEEVTVTCESDGIVIDGAMNSGEWDGAATIGFTANLPDGTTSPGTIFWQVVEGRFYVAVRFERSSLDAGNTAAFEFSEDDFGVRDIFLVSGSVGFEDDVRLEDGSAPTDVSLGGSRDGDGALANDGTYTIYEMFHPLDSGDSYDFSLQSGDTIGMEFFLRIMDAQSVTGDTRTPFIQITIP